MSELIEIIKDSNDDVIAIIVRNGYEKPGINFITEEKYPLQVGIFLYNRGTEIKPHRHRKNRRIIEDTLEVLHIEYGRVVVSLYSNDGEKVKEVVLESGDTIIFVSGGHGLRILDKSKIIEVKQGPYLGVAVDKEYLT